MFSAVINERLYLSYEFDDFFYKSDAEAVVNQVEELLDANRDEFLVESVYTFFAENQAGTTIILTRKDLNDDEIKELRTQIRDAPARDPRSPDDFPRGGRRGRQHAPTSRSSSSARTPRSSTTSPTRRPVGSRP